MKNLPNRITIARIILSIFIIIMLCFPYQRVNIMVPHIDIGGIEIEITYFIAGILFVIASVTDFLDGYIARKYGLVSNTGKMLDAIADKLLVDSVLIVLAGQGQIHEIIPVIIVMRDIVVNAIKMQAASNGKVVAAIKSGKIKTASQMVGVVLVFYKNLPFALFLKGARVGEYLLYFATLMALISMWQYWSLNKNLISEPKTEKK
jgi:CDP-diacylglycerol--glycerol-3-phosphate 3-phosphatidyltransferase